MAGTGCGREAAMVFPTAEGSRARDRPRLHPAFPILLLLLFTDPRARTPETRGKTVDLVLRHTPALVTQLDRSPSSTVINRLHYINRTEVVRSIFRARVSPPAWRDQNPPSSRAARTIAPTSPPLASPDPSHAMPRLPSPPSPLPTTTACAARALPSRSAARASAAAPK